MLLPRAHDPLSAHCTVHAHTAVPRRREYVSARRAHRQTTSHRLIPTQYHRRIITITPTSRTAAPAIFTISITSFLAILTTMVIMTRGTHIQVPGRIARPTAMSRQDSEQRGTLRRPHAHE